MRFRQAEALLLDVAPLGDADRVVAFLTRDSGRKRGVAQGARRRYSRHAGQLQLLSKVDVQWLEKEGRELVRLTRVELVRPADRLFADLEGILVASVLAEMAGTFAPEDEPSELVFRLLDSTIEALLGGVDRTLALRDFESWILRLSGIFPAPEHCPSCGRELEAAAILVAGDGGLICAACGQEESEGRRVSRAALELLRRIGREPLRRMAETPPAASVLAEVGQIAGAVRRGFLQQELKSVLVLERTLGEDGKEREA